MLNTSKEITLKEVKSLVFNGAEYQLLWPRFASLDCTGARMLRFDRHFLWKEFNVCVRLWALLPSPPARLPALRRAQFSLWRLPLLQLAGEHENISLRNSF